MKKKDFFWNKWKLQIHDVLNFIIQILTMVICGALSVLSIVRTSTWVDGVIVNYKDNIILNFIGAIIVFIVIGLIVHFLDKITILTPKRLILLYSFLLGMMCLGIMVITKNVPAADQKTVIRIAKICIDPFHYDQETITDLFSYIRKFPYQIGIVSVYQMIFQIFGIENTTEEVHAFNLICYVGSLILLSSITYNVFENKKILIYQIVVTIMFLPFFFMVPFCYGDIPSLFFALLSIRLYMCKSWIYNVLSIISITMCYILKTNSIVFLIGFMIMILLDILKHKDIKKVILAMAIIIVPLMVMSGLKTIYSQKYQFEINNGSPYLGNICMGLTDSDVGPGRYTGYVIKVHDRYDGNVAEMSKDAKEQIVERMKQFGEKPGYALKFFIKKIITMYSMPMTEAISNNEYYGGDGPLIEVINSIHHGSIGERLDQFMNYYQIIFYIIIWFGLIQMCKINYSPGIFGLVIYFLGIFLLELIWEAQGRYILPSLVCMLPVAGYGINGLFDKILKNHKNCGVKKDEK